MNPGVREPREYLMCRTPLSNIKGMCWSPKQLKPDQKECVRVNESRKCVPTHGSTQLRYRFKQTGNKIFASVSNTPGWAGVPGNWDRPEWMRRGNDPHSNSAGLLVEIWPAPRFRSNYPKSCGQRTWRAANEQDSGPMHTGLEARMQANLMLQMGVSTPDTSNIKGNACNMAHSHSVWIKLGLKRWLKYSYKWGTAYLSLQVSVQSG